MKAGDDGAALVNAGESRAVANPSPAPSINSADNHNCTGGAGEPFRRRVPNRAQTLDILLGQGADLRGFAPPKRGGEQAVWMALAAQNISVPCGNHKKCATLLIRRSDAVRDHKIALRKVAIEQRADHDRPWNQWYLCRSCNRDKTSKRGLTGLGSDAAAIAKLRRIEKGQKACPKTQATSQATPQAKKKSIPSQPFPAPLKKRAWAKAARKWPSRPIPKRARPQSQLQKKEKLNSRTS